MARRLVAGAFREVVSSHRVDDGGMFAGEVGIYMDGGKFVVYATDGWGAGRRVTRDSLEEAMAEIPRIKKRMFG